MQRQIELFDGKGQFVMPSAAAVAELDADKQERFAAVRAAATELETFKASRKTPKAVNDALDERDAAEKDLRRLQPKITMTQNAKDVIASNRAG
jgi:hypothetical protein